MMKYTYTYLLLLVFCTYCKGQNKTNLSKDKINSKTKDSISLHGPNSGVFEIKQDRKGNIWIATNDGVYKYDGRSFSNITSKVSSARFISVLEDRKGNFWFASLGSGVYFYDGKSFRNFTTGDGLASNRVFCMYEDRAGNIWFGTNDGASRYDGKSFRKLKMKNVPAPAGADSVHVSAYQSMVSKDSWLHNDIHTIIEDKTGKLWFGTRGNTFIYDGKTFTPLANKDGKAFNNVWRILEDRKGNIWFGADGLWRFNGSTFTKINQTGAGVIVEDRKGNILASSGGAIFRFDEQSLSNKNPHVTEIETKGEGLKNLPFGILGANDGSIWFASGGGVSRYDGKTLTDF
ncbi:two-component regulator propeller domain-containing protein [Pedobacter sp. P351]|uniref:ligand-binding sensor domain-containing protein n=1 Tax=Pedobacter superstes TaxID=3133441 RepID=UPI0030A635E9